MYSCNDYNTVVSTTFDLAYILIYGAILTLGVFPYKYVSRI